MGYKHVIPQLIQKVLESNEHGTPIRIHGDGLQTRAFAHVDDIISGLIVLMHNNSASGLFNIGNPEEITIFDLLGIIKKKLNCDADVLYEKDYYTGTNRRCPNIDKISHLGYRPTISIFDGIQPVINWYSKNPVNTTSNIKI
jgi:UDP-glucose 4-epimerase